MARILVAVTSCANYDGGDRPTGLWLGEFVHFYEELHGAALDIDIVSPKGGATPLDPAGLRGLAMDATIRAFQADASKMSLLEKTIKSSEIRGDEYSAIYYTGGHGTIWDFPGDAHLQAAARRIYEGGGCIAAVCHGVAALLNLT